MTPSIPRFTTSPIPPAPARAGTRARDARPGRAHAPALAAALPCVLALFAGVVQARTPHAPKAASAPTTEQVLAPSAATVPDALPPDKRVFRCGSSYSAHPCPATDAKPLDIADTRSDAQRRQSEDVTARDKRLAAWYEAGRRQREAVASAPAGGRVVAVAPACVDTTTKHCAPKKPRTRTASSAAASGPAPARRR